MRITSDFTLDLDYSPDNAIIDCNLEFWNYFCNLSPSNLVKEFGSYFPKNIKSFILCSFEEDLASVTLSFKLINSLASMKNTLNNNSPKGKITLSTTKQYLDLYFIRFVRSIVSKFNSNLYSLFDNSFLGISKEKADWFCNLSFNDVYKLASLEILMFRPVIPYEKLVQFVEFIKLNRIRKIHPIKSKYLDKYEEQYLENSKIFPISLLEIGE